MGDFHTYFVMERTHCHPKEGYNKISIDISLFLVDGITSDFVTDFFIGSATQFNAKFFFCSIVFEHLLTLWKVRVVCCSRGIDHEIKNEVLGSLR